MEMKSKVLEELIGLMDDQMLGRFAKKETPQKVEVEAEIAPTPTPMATQAEDELDDDSAASLQQFYDELLKDEDEDRANVPVNVVGSY